MWNLVVPLVCCAAQPTAAQLATFNRAAQESIHAVHVKISYEYEGVPTAGAVPTYRGEYWRKPDAIRVREWYPDEQNEYLIAGGVGNKICTLIPAPGERRVSIVRSRSDATNPIMNAWSMGLFESNREPIYQLIQKPAATIRRAVEPDTDSACFLVVIPEQGYRREVWLEPTVNYLARRLDLVFEDGARVERVVQSFQEPSPGLFFPKDVIRKSVPSPKVVTDRASTQVIKLEIVSLNQLIPDSVFRLDYPRGALMSDELTQTFYTVDESGRAIGPARPLVSALPPPTDEPPGRASTIPTVHPLDYWPWGVGLGSVVLIGYAWLRRRKAD